MRMAAPRSAVLAQVNMIYGCNGFPCHSFAYAAGTARVSDSAEMEQLEQLGYKEVTLQVGISSYAYGQFAEGVTGRGASSALTGLALLRPRVLDDFATRFTKVIPLFTHKPIQGLLIAQGVVFTFLQSGLTRVLKLMWHGATLTRNIAGLLGRIRPVYAGCISELPMRWAFLLEQKDSLENHSWQILALTC